MRQVVNVAKGGPLLGHSSCMTMKALEGEESPKSGGPRQQVERERRMRREIANSNERRRMQSINHGYQMLKDMLPSKDGGEKLSKAAVLQQAAEFMGQLIEERKQLLRQNAELTKTLNSQQRTVESSNSLKRRKRDTESSDEGISLVYQPANPDSAELIEELRRDVTELRVQLEREKQKRVLLEQSHMYNLMAAAQAAQVSPGVRGYTSETPISPPQSRHSSVEEIETAEDSYRQAPITGSYPTLSANSAEVRRSADPTPTSADQFGKASSVASQNLSIIVEAINHLESDKHRLTAADKDVDSGVSHGESSDDTKSDCSRTETPQPPPAHQSVSSGPLLHHPSLYVTSSYTPAPVSLVYRPTFLSTLVANAPQHSMGHATSNHHCT